MPNCDFYALADDCLDVLGFIFAQPGWLLYELSSEPERPTRSFRSLNAVTEAFTLCERALNFHLYAPEMRGVLVERRIDFKPGAVPGATHRFVTEGWGLIQLYFGIHRKNGDLTASHTNHNSETRAKTWARTIDTLGDPAAWDWRAVTRVSGRLCRYIRKRGVTKAWSRPVLPAANQGVVDGMARLRLNG